MCSMKTLIIFYIIHCFQWTLGLEIPTPVAAERVSSNGFEKLGDTFEALEDRLEDVIDHYSAFAGKIFPILSKLYISPEKARNIYKAINTVQEPGDWIFIFLVGWATLPVIRYPYEQIALKKRVHGKELNDLEGTEASLYTKQFNETFLYHFATHISQAGKIAALVYGLDCIAISLETIGFKAATKYSPMCAKVIYTVWMFSRFNTFKKYLVYNAFRVSDSKLAVRVENRAAFARAKIVNNILEIILFAACLFIMVDLLHLKAGVALNSLFAVSGAGTLLASFASKDIAMEVVSGLSLQASDKIYEGEKVLFGNGVKGVVVKIGMLETIIRDSSEKVTAIPNKELAGHHITNLSRNRFSQVKQTLHFEYDDLEKLPDLMEAIKIEIAASCPFVVTDGSKPFRAYFHNYSDQCLDVIVDVRMGVTPSTSSYHHYRQEVLMAIGRAVKLKQMSFAVLED